MTRVLAVSIAPLLALVAVGAEKDRCAAVSTAQDARFELSLKDHSASFQVGEIVPLTLSFTSATKGRYTAMVATYDRSGRLNEETYCVEPESPDPLDTYYKTRGMMGGGLRGMQQLSEAPFLAEAELNEWRSLPPGHYRVYAISSRVSRPRDPQEDNPNPNVGETLRSNTVDIDVSAADPAWQREQLRAAVSTLDGKASPDEARHAARVLRFLETRDAAREMAKRFWGLNEQGQAGWEYMFGLYGSPHRETAMEAMQAELAAPSHAITSEFLDALVNLQVNADAHWANPPIRDPPNPGEMKAFWEGRREREQEFTKAALATVLESLPRKIGSARAITLHGLLTAGQGNAALAATLRPALIAAWADLPAETQQELVLYRWSTVEGPEMLPILRKILAEPPPAARTQQAMTRSAALQHLYELDPASGKEAILAELRSDHGQPGMNVAMLLSKEDLAPAVSNTVERIGKDTAREVDYELVDRYADAAALPVIRAAFEKKVGQWGCGPQSAMLRYFLRVSAEYGAAEAGALLAARKATGCYKTLLTGLEDQLPKAQQVAVDALADSDSEVVQDAVQALGKWGSKDAEAALWKRLEQFHREWEGRADELRSAPDFRSAGSRGAMLEQALAAAIGQGTSWPAPPEKLARLRELMWTKSETQQIEGWSRQWRDGTATITPYWFPEDKPTFGVLQYTSLTEEQLRAKIAQLPHDIELRWQFWPGARSSPPVAMEKQEAVYERVRADAAAHGVVVGRQ